MAVEVSNHDPIAPNAALSNTIRNRIVAFAPIAVALIGIGIMAAAGPGDRSQLIGSTTGVDPVVTGTTAE